ncbi:MAG: Spy/CpxP family protein refolding chaperone [Opitutaceae bacterium]|nr:Spy/CpxP family protein refolding chaperone [Opitutaceae bacterium]
MKSSKLFFAASLALAALSIPSIRAQNPDKPAHEGRRGQVADRLSHLSKELSLTDAQKVQVKEIVTEQAAAMKALADDTSLSKQDRRTKLMGLMRSTNGKIRAVLTPEQQATFDKMSQEGRGRRGRGKAGGESHGSSSKSSE